MLDGNHMLDITMLHQTSLHSAFKQYQMTIVAHDSATSTVLHYKVHSAAASAKHPRLVAALFSAQQCAHFQLLIIENRYDGVNLAHRVYMASA